MDVSRVGAARRKGVWGEKASTHRLASPLHYARRDAPPLLLLHAEHDTPDRRQQNQAMFVALKKAGHPDVAIPRTQGSKRTTASGPTLWTATTPARDTS